MLAPQKCTKYPPCDHRSCFFVCAWHQLAAQLSRWQCVACSMAWLCAVQSGKPSEDEGPSDDGLLQGQCYSLEISLQVCADVSAGSLLHCTVTCLHSHRPAATAAACRRHSRCSHCHYPGQQLLLTLLLWLAVHCTDQGPCCDQAGAGWLEARLPKSAFYQQRLTHAVLQADAKTSAIT